MNDYFVSLIRTWVPVGIGFALTWLARELGIVIDEDTGVMASLVAVSVVISAYYALARLVEQRWPGLGRALIALGLTGRREPMYPSSSQVRSPRA